ncbi:MAG TPA: ParA family protein [Acidimicrobiales bacterium]|nr:ParA family protein [Acidimicrobiales bacterium]
MLANHKGGVTKTTSTANLGVLLAEVGQRVLIVDCDPQANLSELFGWTEELPGERLEDLLARPDASGRYTRQSRCNLTSGRSLAGGSCFGSSRPPTHSPTSRPTSQGSRATDTRTGWRRCSRRCGSSST